MERQRRARGALLVRSLTVQQERQKVEIWHLEIDRGAVDDLAIAALEDGRHCTVGVARGTETGLERLMWASNAKEISRGERVRSVSLK
jgi:hypothetical protein